MKRYTIYAIDSHPDARLVIDEDRHGEWVKFYDLPICGECGNTGVVPNGFTCDCLFGKERMKK